MKGKITFTTHDNELESLEEGLFYARSYIEDILYTYPLKLMVPEHASSSNTQWLYMITFGGGIVQGDIVDLEVTINKHASVLVTTQSATKVYICKDNLITKQVLTFQAAASSFLAVLPDPVMCFSEANFSQRQDVHMHRSANVIILDWLYAGRVARGESWDFTKYETRCSLHIDKTNVYRDGLILQDTPLLSVKKSMNKFTVVGNLIIIGNHLTDLSKQLCNRFNKPKGISGVYDNEKFICASMLDYVVGTGDDHTKVKGCVVRFAMQTTAETYGFLSEILEPLYPVLGGNPFINK